MADNEALVVVLARIATDHHASSAQIALAWLLNRKPWIVPIPGTTKLSRVDENIGAVSLTLSASDLRMIDTAAAKITSGRYPEALEKMTGL